MARDRGRLLTDENFPEPVSRELRSRGYDVDRVRRHGKDKWGSLVIVPIHGNPYFFEPPEGKKPLSQPPYTARGQK